MRRLTPGEVLVGAGGLVLLVTLFLPWFDDDSAFDALSVILALLLLTALLGIALLAATIVQRSQAHPVAAEVFATAIAVPTTLLVLYRIVNPPGSDADVRVGALLGLLAVLAVAVGAIIAMRREERP